MGRKRGARGERPEPAAGGPGTATAVPHLPLRILAFVAGAALMALEIVGSRLLAPHFGNSVFVWGSLITVFLTALACGYYLGGHLADRWPTLGVLASVAAAAGLWILVVPWIGHPLLGWLLRSGLDEQVGPLVGSLVLFLAPSLLLGAVSPLAIRLAAPEVAAVGRTAGTLYALSTLGSIAGTLLTTFVLIPSFGVAAILRGIGAAMALVSGAMLLVRPARPAAAATAGVATALLLFLPVARSVPLEPGDRVIEELETPYHDIAVIERGGDRRLLLFDRHLQSGFRLAPPYPSLGVYTDYFHLAFVAKPDLRRVLFLGAGGGIGPREFLAVDPQLHVDVVDVDPAVLRIAERHFRMPRTTSLRATARDARIFLARSDARWDAIVLDAFTVGGRIPFHLTTREFFALCRERLAPDGVLLMNVNSALSGERGRIFQAIGRTLGEVFPQLSAFASDNPTDPLTAQAIVLLASEAAVEPGTEAWQQRVAAFGPKSLFEPSYLESMSGAHRVPLPAAGTGELLTDDHVAIDTMRF